VNSLTPTAFAVERPESPFAPMSRTFPTKLTRARGLPSFLPYLLGVCAPNRDAFGDDSRPTWRYQGRLINSGAFTLCSFPEEIPRPWLVSLEAVQLTQIENADGRWRRAFSERITRPRSRAQLRGSAAEKRRAGSTGGVNQGRRSVRQVRRQDAGDRRNLRSRPLPAVGLVCIASPRAIRPPCCG
jgi:hypothetical protein